MTEKPKLRSFDIKVVGYEAVQAESADAALELFDEMLKNGYTLGNLRWKSYTATAVGEDTEPCKGFHPPIEKPKKAPERKSPERKPPRCVFFCSREARDTFRRNAPRLDYADLIICTLANAQGEVVKSKLLNFIDGLFWEGYASSYYVHHSRQVGKAFDYLVACGTIRWEPRNPVVLVEEL